MKKIGELLAGVAAAIGVVLALCTMELLFSILPIVAGIALLSWLFGWPFEL